MEYDNLVRDLENFMPSFGDMFYEFYNQMIEGGELPGISVIWELLKNTVAENINDTLGVVTSLLMIGILSAVLNQCSNIFSNRQIGELAFYFSYLYAVILLLNTFYVMAETAVLLVENIITFTQLMIPAFYIAVAMCYASVTAGAFYQLNLLLLYAVEIIFPEIVIPMITCFVFTAVISGSTADDRFEELTGLLKKGVTLLIKICITTVTGVGVMKSLIHPAADCVQYTLFQKTIAAIPGIGDVTDSVSKMFLGSAVLIKNGIGVTALILMILLACAPLTKIFILAGMIKVSSACVGMFGDKRLTKCIDRVSEGGFLLLKATLAVVMILFIMIAMVTAVAGRGM
ncbi:MAG: stage III sporulation protein AE [Lachnospiraceae bacterium]|nr:stage III sporulation protein AE [Lachnospiraceae bacterium]